MTEEERKKAVEQAKKYEEKNPKKDGSLYGKKNEKNKGGPGEKVDCSGLVSNSIKTAGVKDPNHGPEGQNGVKNIVDNTRSVETGDAQSGNIVTFKVDGVDNAHIGIITNVTDNGKITMIHSGASTGPTSVTFDPNAKNTYWGGKFEGVRVWDTPDPVTQKSNNSTQTTTSTTNSTRTEMPSRSTNSTFLWFLKGF